MLNVCNCKLFAEHRLYLSPRFREDGNHINDCAQQRHAKQSEFLSRGYIVEGFVLPVVVAMSIFGQYTALSVQTGRVMFERQYLKHEL